MASFAYNNFKKAAWQGNINLTGGVVRIALVTSNYSATASHSTLSDLTAVTSGEVSSGGGTNYSRQTLAGATLTIDTAGNQVKFTGTSPSWSSASFSANAAVLFQRAGGADAGSDPLIAYLDFGSTYTATNGTFTVTWNATNGIMLSKNL
jgi:hypothetical protein